MKCVMCRKTISLKGQARYMMVSVRYEPGHLQPGYYYDDWLDPDPMNIKSGFLHKHLFMFRISYNFFLQIFINARSI